MTKKRIPVLALLLSAAAFVAVIAPSQASAKGTIGIYQGNGVERSGQN